MTDNNLCPNCFTMLEENQSVCPICGFSIESEIEKYHLSLPYGSILAGRYITGRVLGQGGFGITYAAKDIQTGKKIAIKEFFPDTLAHRSEHTYKVSAMSGDRQENFEYGLECFINEAKILAKFSDHPNVVTIYNCFKENGTAYFAMEYIDGINFKQYIKNHGGKISWQEAVKVLVPVMEALEAVHKEGIIHRDVTPDNIYITNDGQIKLLDFGSARFSMGDKTKTLDVILKHGYAPKEQYLRKGKQGAYTDVYSVAACFYAAITGHVPPDAPERMDEDNLIPPSTRVSIPDYLDDAIIKGLEIQPADRYQNMGEFLSAVNGGFENNNRSVSGNAQNYSYDGVMQNGVFEGTIKFSNGDIYKGQAEGNLDKLQMSGTGTLIYADGSVYKGSFRNNNINGTGKVILADGNIYEGGFKDGMFSGHGKMTLKDGNVFEGEYENGKENGFGKLINKDGTVFEGNFKNGKQDGKCKITYKDGKVVTGVWAFGSFIADADSKKDSESQKDIIVDKNKKISVPNFFKLCFSKCPLAIRALIGIFAVFGIIVFLIYTANHGDVSEPAATDDVSDLSKITLEDILNDTAEEENSAEEESPISFALGDDTVNVAGNDVEMGAAPYIETTSDEILVPLGFVSAVYGDDAEIVWDGTLKRATIFIYSDGEYVGAVQFTAGSKDFIVDGVTIPMGSDGVAADIVDGSMYVPFKYLAMALRFDWEYDDTAKTVTFNKYQVNAYVTETAAPLTEAATQVTTQATTVQATTVQTTKTAAVVQTTQASVKSLPSTKDGNITYTLDGDKLIVSGSGKMRDYENGNKTDISKASASSMPGNAISVKSVVIESGVTHIGNNAFDNFDSLRSVTISNTVTSIGEAAFYGCDCLYDITIPNSVTSIGRDAFSCSGLKEITLSNNLKEISMACFEMCFDLKEITLPGSVTSIGDFAFSDCESLKTVNIMGSVKSVGEEAFSGCYDLETVKCVKGSVADDASLYPSDVKFTYY